MLHWQPTVLQNLQCTMLQSHQALVHKKKTNNKLSKTFLI